jgi:hypothetical protein
VNLGTPNKPLEWTGHHQLFTGPAQIHCLPLRDSVRPTMELALLWASPGFEDKSLGVTP